MADRELRLEHRIGADGRFRLRTASGTVRLEGRDTDLVELLARYASSRGIGLATAATEDGILAIERSDDALEVSVRGGGGGPSGLPAPVAGIAAPDVHLVVTLPHRAGVRLDLASADAVIQGLHGVQDLRTVSGDLRIDGAGGDLRITTVSGDVELRGDVLALEVTTTSGDIGIEAELLRSLAARSVSGDVSIRARLEPGERFSFESVSGNLELATRSGLTIEHRGLSGSVRSQLPARRERIEGRTATIIGDGRSHVRARTVSGDVVVAGPPEKPAPVGPARPAADTPGAADLEILRALERGEIDVEEAARRLGGDDDPR